MSNNELTHYGVLGMKWGVRKIKSAVKNSDNKQVRSVEKSYQKEFEENKEYNALGQKSTAIAKQILKRESSEIEPSKTTLDLYSEMDKIDTKMQEIERSIGDKYIAKLNSARLEDIKYTDSYETGIAFLTKANLNFTMRNDGYISTRKIFGGTSIDNGSDYIRPYNL